MSPSVPTCKKIDANVTVLGATMYVPADADLNLDDRSQTNFHTAVYDITKCETLIYYYLFTCWDSGQGFETICSPKTISIEGI